MTSNERHRLSLIIATLGPSTDNEKELIQSSKFFFIASSWNEYIDCNIKSGDPGFVKIIEDNVIIGDNTTIGSHTIIKEYTEIGQDCNIFSHCVIGEVPQDKKYNGEKSKLIIAYIDPFFAFSINKPLL